jgi:hypothetical protein
MAEGGSFVALSWPANAMEAISGGVKAKYSNKYEVESFFDSSLAELLAEGSCGSSDDEEAIEGFSDIVIWVPNGPDFD